MYIVNIRARLVGERPTKLCVDIADGAFPRSAFAYFASCLCNAFAGKKKKTGRLVTQSVIAYAASALCLRFVADPIGRK